MLRSFGALITFAATADETLREGRARGATLFRPAGQDDLEPVTGEQQQLLVYPRQPRNTAISAIRSAPNLGDADPAGLLADQRHVGERPANVDPQPATSSRTSPLSTPDHASFKRVDRPAEASQWI
jgi:hypothetical protein